LSKGYGQGRTTFVPTSELGCQNWQILNIIALPLLDFWLKQQLR
jgi:hypothetical protein